MKLLFCLLAALGTSFAQEAQSGLQVEGTLSGGTAFSSQLSAPPRDGLPWASGGRFVLYPKWKINSHWSFLAAVQLRSRPFFFAEFDDRGYGLKYDILQAQLAYSRIAKDRSFSFRAGQMPSAFGSFLLRYDDARNPLIDMPISYGYYSGVTTLGLMGAEIDATFHRFDFRAQLTNSSPANPRSIFQKDQYANWTGGLGYTVIQGVRVGASAYRGPYLDRQSQFFNPGEAPPRSLPATGYSLEFEAARGPWNFYSELQRFQYAYKAVPTFNQKAWYAEIKRTLTPRWYAAFRVNRLTGDYNLRETVYETALGFRPNRFQIVKFDYERQSGPETPGSLGNIFAIQLVTGFSPISLTRN